MSFLGIRLPREKIAKAVGCLHKDIFADDLGRIAFEKSSIRIQSSRLLETQVID